MDASKSAWKTPELVIHGSVEKVTGTNKRNGTADYPFPSNNTLTASEPLYVIRVVHEYTLPHGLCLWGRVFSLCEVFDD